MKAGGAYICIYIHACIHTDVLSFGDILDWHAGIRFTHEVTEYFVQQTACVESGASDVHLP
jgi:hypothetical protein